MANPRAIRKLNNEYKSIMADPVPGLRVVPDPANILDWHYVITGPEDSPYAGGEYYGKLTFPTNYPMAPPKIVMFTPSGRFKPGARICTSMSDYHPETWSPGWTISTILIGLISFMLDENDGGVGSLRASVTDRQRLAERSSSHNQKLAKFRELFLEEEFTLLLDSKIELA